METCTILVFTTLYTLISASSSSSLVTDFHALASMKEDFSSSSSPNPVLESWDTSNRSSVCSWVGIECSRGHVVLVNLSGLGLTGPVPLEIWGMDGLSELRLDGNNFTGEIKIGNGMKGLRFLNISNNMLSGGLDWNFSSFESLQVLDAYNNNFTASLPAKGILGLKNLRHLDLGGNFFYGEIPKGYGDLVGLEYLSLAGNDLHGKIPQELGNLTSLKELYLGYYNVYEGGIPMEFGKMENLLHLDMSSCGLDGEIPSQLGNLKNLDTLFLHINLLSGSIPRELGNLSALQSLDLSDNSLTGEIPPEFRSFKNLHLLNLFMNRLHGSIPDFISGFPELRVLGLWKNNFTGVVPRSLGRNQKLRELDLSSNKLTGTIPENLCSSRRLRVLILLKNFLFGPVPEDLGSCSSLVRVRLGDNYLNGSIPEGFLYLPELNLVELQNNMVTGALPENRGVSSKPVSLGRLNLSNNKISGSLPVSLSNFTSLQILLLGQNNFSGPIPASVGELRQALKIDLSGNSLSGEIPGEIGNCVHLTYLDLSQNNLSGPIPTQISEIRILNYLNLSRNHLTGDFPKSVGTMRSLTAADFSFNDLSGKLPESGIFNATSFAGNPRLCWPLLNNTCNFAVVSSQPGNSLAADFKLVFAVGLLLCSLAFATAAIIKAKSFQKTASGGSWKLTSFQKVDFTAEEVVDCVRDGNVIGKGGAGVVYHGKTGNGSEIAVKKLAGFNRKSKNDHGFRAEIETLGNIRHRNIVRLLAFCSNNRDTNLLVYEYMKNGSLGEALHGGGGKKCGGGMMMSWNQRYKIAVESAKGLCYLHHDCSPLIVHRDVKSNNILLDSSYEAHVADFGLAKFLVDGGGASQCMSAIAGSYGYIAPEYAYTLRVDEKSDVYSFGVVLLELLTGRRPVGDFGEGVDIVQWSRVATAGGRREEVAVVLDPKLAVVPVEEAMHLFFIAMLCVQDNSVERPTMREVVQMLSEFPRRPQPPPQQPANNNHNYSPNNKNVERGKN
ncbi:hypothetical protein DM860_012951 [Cuscuta australis]|uniref:non-specific serine/threonine protein kinase n=1 Tax=Cuscuta australis TaxID=267555 RepID=A0A328DYF2_9ASTE|nr:hypothetical protein DM860_012951 [Cuscuta australis]